MGNRLRLEMRLKIKATSVNRAIVEEDYKETEGHTFQSSFSILLFMYILILLINSNKTSIM